MVRFRRLFLIPVDVLLIVVSRVAAYMFRFEGTLPPLQERFFWVSLVVSLAVTPALFVFAGFYRRLWRYASIPDLLHIVKTTTLASLVTTLVTLFLLRDPEYSRSIPVLAWVFLTALILARSILWRLVQEHRYRQDENDGTPTLIVGAGMGGKTLLQEIRQSPSLAFNVVGFLDDDTAKIGCSINGKQVHGAIADLRRVARETSAEQVIIAIPSASSKIIRQVVHLCQTAGLAVKTLPAFSDMLDRSHLASQLRGVNVHDLLGRDTVKLETRRIEAYLTGRKILVTGAGGSIGSEICRQVARFKPSVLLLLEMAETPLHDISLELERDFPDVPVRAVLGDIRDKTQVGRVFQEASPDVVFHAAAYKHVPMMEYHPAEAVKTNILGTKNLARAADEAGVERFVMISTDKAVNPTNVMGASKRVAELFVQSFNESSSTEFVTVRFGNVLGSSGSVVPLFQEQIRRGGPVTVTHPDVIRYFMTIPEASQLVLQAGSMGKGGEIFLLDMGDPVRIADLAEELIRLSGLEPGKDIEIAFTGLRPGEKLFEELLIDGEGVKPTEHKKIRVANARRANARTLEKQLSELTFCSRQDDDALVVEKLRELVPEYQPHRRVFGRTVVFHPAAASPSLAPTAET